MFYVSCFKFQVYHIRHLVRKAVGSETSGSSSSKFSDWQKYNELQNQCGWSASSAPMLKFPAPRRWFAVSRLLRSSTFRAKCSCRSIYFCECEGPNHRIETIRPDAWISSHKTDINCSSSWQLSWQPLVHLQYWDQHQLKRAFSSLLQHRRKQHSPNPSYSIATHSNRSQHPTAGQYTGDQNPQQATQRARSSRLSDQK